MGGNAVQGVGKVSRWEIEPTLNALSEKVGIELEYLLGNLLGSVGKKDYSGDIDIAMQYRNDNTVSTFYTMCLEEFGEDNVVRHGKNVHIKFPIAEYEPEPDDPQPRTGFVQVDFLFGDIDFMKIYSYAPSPEESDYAGTHRNLGIISICRWLDRIESPERDSYDRPIETIRWKWSPVDGLVKVIRKSKRNKVNRNKWNVSQYDVYISMPLKDKRSIVGVLFKGVGGMEQIDTLENIINGVKRSYHVADQDRIFKTMAEEFTKHPRLCMLPWVYPPEVAKYMED